MFGVAKNVLLVRRVQTRWLGQKTTPAYEPAGELSSYACTLANTEFRSGARVLPSPAPPPWVPNLTHLMHVLLHSQPLLVADGKAAVPPFVVVAPLFGVTEYLLGILQVKGRRQSNLRVWICAREDCAREWRKNWFSMSPSAPFPPSICLLSPSSHVPLWENAMTILSCFDLCIFS
jgi:hypothetical protein